MHALRRAPLSPLSVLLLLLTLTAPKHHYTHCRYNALTHTMRCDAKLRLVFFYVTIQHTRLVYSARSIWGTSLLECGPRGRHARAELHIVIFLSIATPCDVTSTCCVNKTRRQVIRKLRLWKTVHFVPPPEI